MGASIHKMASHEYYPRQALDDYYSTGSLAAGEYFGRGAGTLTLLGKEVVLPVCKLLARGIAPDGKTRLAQSNPNRFEGPDVTFSLKKWGSVLWGTESDPHRRAAIERATVAAAKDGLQFLEDKALFSRRGKGGSRVEQCFGMVATIWLHTTSRANEPQLHVHSCIYNEVLRPDGTWGTILGITRRRGQTHAKAQSALHDLRLEAGKVFDRSFERRMQELGYKLEPSADGLSLQASVPQKLLDAFSSRRAQILTRLDETHEHGAAAAARAAIMTRPRKKLEQQETLLSRWREIGLAHGFDPASVRHEAGSHTHREVLTDRGRHTDTDWDQSTAERSAHTGLNKNKQKRAWSASSRGLERSARSRRSDEGQTLADGSQGNRPASERDDTDWRTLRDTARVSKLLRHSTNGGARGGGPRVTKANVYLATKQAEISQGAGFTEAEKAALALITRGRGSVQFLGGSAGERLAPVLKAAATAWRRQGYRVLLASGSRAAAERYEHETGIHAVSTAGLLKGLSTNRGLLQGYDSALRASMKIPAGFRSSAGFLGYALAASGRWICLNARTVVIVDNPSILELDERIRLLKEARRSGARLVFVDAARDAPSIRERLLGQQLKPGMERARRRAREDERERN